MPTGVPHAERTTSGQLGNGEGISFWTFESGPSRCGVVSVLVGCYAMFLFLSFARPS
jgi:hypothetical protein